MGRRPKQTFLQRRIQMAKKHMKRCSALLIIRELQIKTAVRYYLTPVRMAIIKKSTNIKCQRGCGEKRTLLYGWWECKLVTPLWKTIWKFLKKLKVELRMILQSDFWAYSQREKHGLKGYMHSSIHCSTAYSSQDVEAT